MKKALILTIGILVLGIIILGGVLLLQNASRKGTQAPPSTNPFGFANGSSTQASQQNQGMLPIKLSNGSQVSVPDFTKQPQPTWATTNEYLVSGTPTDDYLITYVPGDSNGSPAEFLITLQNEPLGNVRLEAEQALRKMTGIPDSELCLLDTRVLTQPGLSDAYDGKSLGLSFCPGAIQLP